MTRNIWIGIVVVVVLVAGGWWYFNQSSAPAVSETTDLSTTQQNTNTGNQAPITQTPTTPVAKNWTAADFSWQVEDLGVDQYGRPKHRVILQVGASPEAKYTIGEYFMNCRASDNAPAPPIWPALPGELSRMYCSLGGGEWSIVVAKENGRYIVKSAYTTEEDPTVIVESKYKTILEVK